MSTAAAMTTDIHELSHRQALFIGYFLNLSPLICFK